MKTSELFKDGTHKWGGSIYATNTHDDHGIYAGRVHVGVVKKLPKAHTESHPGQVYLINDWTQQSVVDGRYVPTKVQYTKTRKEAMAVLETARLKLEKK